MEGILLCLVALTLFITLGAYRDTVGRLHRVERNLEMLLRHQGLDPNQAAPLSERVRELASDPGRKLEAIREYRRETGAGLRETVDVIEAFARGENRQASRPPAGPS